MDKKKKSPRKSSAPKLKDLDVQQRKLAIIKQKQCDTIALNIVSKLIDGRVEDDVFIRSLKYLNQCHYQDIVEERAIIKLCGYPICAHEIKDMPSKKYHISTKSNKVYDITERKNYCSNFCYKAGIHIKDQMLNSPLWFRDKEDIPEFNLLPKTENGVPGKEIDQGIIKLDVDEDKNFTSISQFTQEVKNDIPENIYGPNLAEILKENAEYFKNQIDKTEIINNDLPKSNGILKKKSKNPNKKRVSFSSENSVKEIENIPGAKKVNEMTTRFKKPEQNKIEEKKYKNENLIGVVQERSTIFKEIRENESENMEKEIKNLINKETTKSNKQSRLSRLRNSSTYRHTINSKSKPLKCTNLQTRLNTCVSEWFTFETAVFLYGEEHIKNTISDKSFKQYMSKKKNLELDDKKQKQYDEICKRLNLMELEDQKFHEKVTGKKRLPIPRYETLREQAEYMDLRVQSFYAGCYEMYEEDVTDTETDVESDDEDKLQVVTGPPAVLPLVENKDLMGMRKKIFQTSINRSISTICEVIQESPNRLLSEIKQLINTFEFTANNIVFKTNEWQFVTLLLIQILSIKDKDLQIFLATKEANVYFTSLAEEFNFSNKYIEEILLKKTQIQNLLDECIRKDCVS